MLHKLFIGAVISVALSTTAIAQARLGAVAEGMASTRAQPTQAASKLGKNQKLCRSRKPDGSVKAWTCGADQPCCVNHFFNLYTCGSQLLKCL